MTKKQARIIAEAHEVEQLMNDEEEVSLLEEHNPEMLAAYRALLRLKKQARIIAEALEVEQLMNDEAEVSLLEENNPEMLAAYRALLREGAEKLK